jgi:hypothetical protein
MFELEYAAPERMHVFELGCRRKVDEHLDEAVDRHSGRHAN